MTTREEALELLVHSGVKGMKWGVRRRAIENRNSADRARGSKASISEKLITVSAVSAVKNKGVAKAVVANRNERIARRQRVLDGRASVLDSLRTYGELSLGDIAVAAVQNRKK